jgi:flagellar L-ring protein precursor FlgH
MKCTVMLVTASVMMMAAGVRGQDEGVVPPMGDVRPGEPTPAYTVTPTGPVRGSLFRQGAAAPVPVNAEGMPMGGAPVSFTAVEPAKPRKFKKNDVVTVIVREDSSSSTTGKGNSKKQQSFDVALQQFVQLALSRSGLPTIGTVGNPSNLPEVKFNYNNDRQSQAVEERTDSATLRISGTVVDVKPNGTMVVEATKNITMDKETQHYTLSGICRAEDVTGDNTILSTQMANLTLNKQTAGTVKDGTKRGWLNSIIDTISPF